MKIIKLICVTLPVSLGIQRKFDCESLQIVISLTVSAYSFIILIPMDSLVVSLLSLLV